ncbi:MAG: hypothetical protein QOJ29_2707 [Thermoleophilaceae bacterium]|nr:hypothetical protein [Thermoleophilaceae bacterium]
MPVHSIVLLELSVEHFFSHTFGHVANFSEDEHDLYDLWVRFVTEVEVLGGDTNRERYLLPQNLREHARLREVQVEFEAGRTGERQTVRDTSDGHAKGVIDLPDAATAPLRCLIKVPSDGKVAYMALEMTGHRSVTGHLSTLWKSRFRKHTKGSGFKLNILNLADEAAWDDFIAQAELHEVVFQKRVYPDGNRSAQPRMEEYAVKGAEGAILPANWISRLRRRQIRPSDVLSVDIGDPDQTKIVVDVDGRSRTLRIGQALPTFTYEIDPDSESRPVSSRFYAVARELIDGQLAGPYGGVPRAMGEEDDSE